MLVDVGVVVVVEDGTTSSLQGFTPTRVTPSKNVSVLFLMNSVNVL